MISTGIVAPLQFPVTTHIARPGIHTACQSRSQQQSAAESRIGIVGVSRHVASARGVAVFLVVGGITGSLTLQSATRRVFDVDRKQSRAVIDVGKAGAFSFFAGHTHEVIAPAVGGIIHLDSQDPSHSDVRLEIDARALNVTGKGEPPEDVPKVQQAMLSERVLDVRQYPAIVFQSTNVSIRTQTTAMLDLTVLGQLTLHGVTRAVTVPVNARLDPGRLTGTGHFQLKQSDYGIKPVSVGGVVAVKDTLTISFTIVAAERNGA
jgi:polyisoprenoid-binding protein YceI